MRPSPDAAAQAASNRSATSHAQAEQLAGRLPALLVAAERVAYAVAPGVHGRRRVGQGETFWQYRDYEPGDRPQLIDWRQTAKSDRIFVRQSEWEAAQSVWLWRDASASMDWRSAPGLPSKRERAEVLLLALSILLVQGGERVGLAGLDRYPSNSRHAPGRLALTLTQPSGTLPLPLEALPRHAALVLFGDFLDPVPELARALGHYVERGVKGTLVQVVDPAEVTLPYRGRTRFEGTEGERPWLLSRAESVRNAYQRRLAEHQAALQDACRRLGWMLLTHHSDRPATEGLLSLYGALATPPGRG